MTEEYEDEIEDTEEDDDDFETEDDDDFEDSNDSDGKIDWWGEPFAW